MSPQTLFSAYSTCRDYMEVYAAHRENRTGIAVDDDFLALMWQRYDRLAAKISNRILYPDFKACPICGWQTCSSRCPRYEVNDESRNTF